MTGAAFRFLGPRDNFPLGDADFARACAHAATMVALRAGRADYLAAHGLDPRVYLPGHMWDADFVATNFAKLARQDRRTIEHLRLLCYNFTGFSLLHMAPFVDLPDVAVIPPDADAILRAASPRLAELAAGWTAATAGLPAERIVAAPRLFGESGFEVDGRIVNLDTWGTQQRLNGLHGSGVLDFLQRRKAERGYVRIVEIGAGYGNLAYSLHRILGALDYFVVDLPESMIYSSIYLDTVLAEAPCRVAAPGRPLPAGRGVTFVGNHLLAEFLPQIGTVDLVINVMSLSEMSPPQVAHYGRAVHQLLGTSGVFYEQNYIEPGIQTDVVAILGEQLPYGAEVAETQPAHRGRGVARLWGNRPLAGLWDGGRTRALAAPALLGAR